MTHRSIWSYVGAALLSAVGVLTLAAKPEAAGSSEGGGDQARVREPTSTGDACVIASWPGMVVRQRHVEQLRSQVLPPPTGDRAKRWAVDVLLASWDEHGGITDQTPEEHLRAYRTWLAAHGPRAHRSEQGRAANVADDMRALRARAGVVLGPCHPSESAGTREGP